MGSEEKSRRARLIEKEKLLKSKVRKPKRTKEEMDFIKADKVKRLEVKARIKQELAEEAVLNETEEEKATRERAEEIQGAIDKTELINANVSGRVTLKVTEERKNIILMMILDGYRHNDIVRMCTKWNLSPKTIEGYIKQVNNEIRHSFHVDRSFELNKATARLLQLYNDCIRNKDRRTAVSVLKELNELLGLKSTHLEVTARRGQDNLITKATRVDPIDLSDLELEVLDSLTKRLESNTPPTTDTNTIIDVTPSSEVL